MSIRFFVLVGFSALFLVQGVLILMTHRYDRRDAIRKARAWEIRRLGRFNSKLIL
jgi:hypothetical protein